MLCTSVPTGICRNCIELPGLTSSSCVRLACSSFPTAIPRGHNMYESAACLSP